MNTIQMNTIQMSTDEWLKKIAVEINLITDDDFLKIKETLTRIGIGTNANGVNRLYQTCHILQKRKKYYIVHFKELLLLDGKEVNLSDSDLARRNKIVMLLRDWELLEIVKPEEVKLSSRGPELKIIPHRDKAEWELIPKYTIGSKKTPMQAIY